MAENEFMLELTALLDKAKSKKQINSDIKELEKVIKNLRLTATLAKGTSKQQLNQVIKQLEGQLHHIKLQAKIDQKNLKADVNKALQNVSFKDIDIGVDIDTGKTKLKVQKVIADAKKIAENNPITVNVELKKEKLGNDLTSYLLKHSKIRESESLLKQVDSLRDKISGINDKESLRNVTQEFQLFKSEVSATGYQSKSAGERIKNLLGNVTKVGSAFGVASMAVSNYQKSLKTIKQNDSILTEIGKTSDSTKQELEELGNSAFDTASKFGKASSDYLTAVQEMNRSGFYGEAGKALGELVLLTQAAGDVTAETAQKYLLSTNAAYGYAGSAEKLTRVLDGQNYITNRNSVDMETMAEATEKAGSMAANTGVKIEELSAMIGTISARTKEAGSITGNGIKALLVNLQNISSDKITGTLEKANASMTEMSNGIEKLRTPIAILKDLAKTYNSLDADDPLKSEITTNIGGKYHANQLSALLSGWADYEKMLADYSNGAGSALEEADKSANNLTGRLNALQNTWDELVNSITNKSTIKGGISFFDGLLQSATKLVETFDVLPVALAGVTAFMTAKNKDVGITQVLNEDGKFDIQGNLLGMVNVDQIKHFSQAKKAIFDWNAMVKDGVNDIKLFNDEIVKNNAQLRNYLSTCNDGSASLKGYKASLQAAGIETNSLRLGTVLLNSALSFGIGLAIQGVIAGLDYLIHKEEKAAEALENAKSKFTETVDELKSLNDELTSTQDKIAELQKLADNGTISVADENELKLLKETNDELERKIALKQKEQIDDAKELLRNVQKNNEEKAYSYAHYNDKGEFVTERKQGDASEQLQDTIIQYQDALEHFGPDNVNADNYNEMITGQAEKVGTLVDAYKSLEDAGIKLTKEQQEEYNSALKAQDAYLLYSYNLNKTAEGFRALGEEQQRSVLNGRLAEKGLSDMEAKAVIKEIPKDELEDYYSAGFSFPVPSRDDYKTAEEYGRAYADAWKNGVREEMQEDGREAGRPKIITSISEALSQPDGTEDSTFNDAIDDYQSKISSLQSYLEKLRSGDYSPADLVSLAKDFGITGNSVEELTGKIQNLMDTEMDSITAQIDEILNTENLDEATREQVESLRQSLIDTNKEAQNLKETLSFKTGNALADVQSLSNGLDQLDKIYADILNKEDFDWSSILNNEGFTKAFEAYTDEYENFINTVSKAPNDINACQEAFNKLASAYIYGSGVLDEVTESTKAGTIAMLEQMGVSNAVVIVEQALRLNQEMLAAQKTDTAKETENLTKATADEIDALAKEEGYCESTRLKLLALAMQKQLVNGTTLDFSRDISNIKELVESISGACEALSELDRFKKNSYGYDNLPVGLRKQLEHDAQKEVDDALKKADDPVQFEMPSINFTGGTAAKDAREKLKKEQESAKKDAEKTAEQFDWINTKLNNLIETASRAKDKISDLLSFGSKKKQTQKAIEATTKALEAEYKAMKKYSEIAKTLSADAAKETTETVTDSISDAVNDAVSNAVSSTAGIVNDAMQYVGRLPYVWGGTSLTNGADCSGFTQQLYKAYGINLDRTAQAQYNQNLGIKVTKEELQPGDLVFFNGYKGAGGVGHVGIYVGNGQFVHEPGSGQTAKVSYLSERKDFVGGKRYGNINNMPSSSDASAVSYGTSSGTYTKTVPGIDAKTLAHYQKLVREGSFDVETITNDKLKEAIKSYQEWYDKMKSCRDKIDELNGTLKELYKTMAEIPIEKRDKNVDTLESILGIRESKRDNINAVIVDPKKYASTKKAFKTAKSGLYKSLKTKAQKASSGLTDAEFKTLKSCIKSGKAVPKKILDSITDGALYSRCSEYNDAFYAHTQYADTALSTGDQIKRFNALSNQILSAEKAVTKQYKAAYNAASKDYAASLKKAASAGRKAKKVSTAKDTGLTKAEVNRIKSCIKSGKLIDSDLMLQLESTGAYSTFLKYNKAVLARDAEKEVLDSASFDYEKQRQQEIGKIQEVKTSRHQNIADKADEKVSRNNALMENETSASGKNKYLKDNNRLLDTQYKHLIEIAKLENNLVEAARLEAELQSKKNENTRQAYQNLADEHAAKADYYQLLEDNATSYKDKNSNEEHRLSQMKYQYLNLIKAAFGDELEQKRLAEELQSKINESYKTMFDNIRTGYEQTISLISNDISDLDNEVKKVQASGRLVDASFYNFKMSMEEKNLGVLREEEASLLEQLKNVKMYSSEWYECQDAVQSVQNAQADALVTIKEYKDAINEIANTIQNDIVSAFHDINNEADLLTTLLGDNLSDSDIGGLTQDGLAVLSLYVSQLNVSQDAAKSLHDEINSMQDAADNGILSFIDANGIKRDYASIHDLEKDIKELYSTYQDEIKGTYDYESRIIDLMKQKYQSELDYLKDLIDKKKESLEAEKDLYEYSKNIKGQVSSINSLRKQIAALQGDTSTETYARVQKLQSQLKDAEEELKDTEYDRYISDQEAMLDNLYNEYAELLTDLEKNRDRLLQEGLDLFAQTGSDVQDTIRDTAEQYNYRVTSAMDGIISSIENMGSLSDYFSVGGTVTQSLDNIASEIQKAYTSLSAEIAKGNTSVTIDSTGNTSDGTASIGQTGKYDTYGDGASSGNSGGTSNTADKPSASKPINLSALANAGGAAGAGAYKAFIENFLKKGTNKYDPKTTSSLNKYIHEKYGSALTVGEMSTLSKYLGLNYSASDLAAENKNHQKYKKNILDTLKLQGFSKGGIVKDLEDAVRANGDSVIVSAQPGEAFLTKTDSENIQRFTKSLEYEELSRKLETVMRPMPDLSSINTNARVQDVPVSKQDTTVNVEFGNVDINLPNVMDYADFMTMAQHDPKFERLVTTIMCSNLTGKNYLAKNSIIFNH